MCKSLAEGGQRCSAHTRPAYKAALFGTTEWDQTAAEHASTRKGAREIERLAEAARFIGKTEVVVAAETALANGHRIREVAQETARQVRAHDGTFSKGSSLMYNGREVTFTGYGSHDDYGHIVEADGTARKVKITSLKRAPKPTVDETHEQWRQQTLAKNTQAIRDAANRGLEVGTTASMGSLVSINDDETFTIRYITGAETTVPIMQARPHLFTNRAPGWTYSPTADLKPGDLVETRDFADGFQRKVTRVGRVEVSNGVFQVFDENDKLVTAVSGDHEYLSRRSA